MLLCQASTSCMPSPGTMSIYLNTKKKVVYLNPDENSLYRHMNKKSIYRHAFENYSIKWGEIRYDSLESQITHLKDLSTLNKTRLSNHRIYESPRLRNAHREAYARCSSDKRLGFSLELSRQIRKLLKGPGRGEYKLRMVGGQGGTAKIRSRSAKTVAVAERAANWRGRLRPVKKDVGYKI